MIIGCDFYAKVLSRKETEYQFRDMEKPVVGYKLGIMIEDEVGMIKCTKDACPEEVQFFQDYVVHANYNSDNGSFRIVAITLADSDIS